LKEISGAGVIWNKGKMSREGREEKQKETLSFLRRLRGLRAKFAAAKPSNVLRPRILSARISAK
jgi:hypothetical protein